MNHEKKKKKVKNPKWLMNEAPMLSVVITWFFLIFNFKKLG